VASDDLESDVRRLGSLGFGVDGPVDGGRLLPDGVEIRWRSARMRQEGRLLPFLIEDLTPREMRVPGGPAAEHPNGATGGIGSFSRSRRRHPDTVHMTRVEDRHLP
jgi:hypothetical protein